MDFKILKLTQIITTGLSPQEFYEYLEEYSEDTEGLFGFGEAEQELIDKSWDEVKQHGLFNLNISKIQETQAYKEYAKDN